MASASLILGIETSCDETAAAVIDTDYRLYSSVVASQLDLHSKYGGVVPELASREHLRNIVPVVRAALQQAEIKADQLAAIAVTQGPGLIGSLLVGINYAKAISFATGKPLIAVNHIEGHIHAVLMEAEQQHRAVKFPAITLVVSGGHSHLFLARDRSHYSLLGKTRDDAAGEAYDKVGKLLGFGYPGGPLLDQLAVHGDAKAIRFGRSKMKDGRFDLSFSGLKTAVLYWVRDHDLLPEAEERKRRAVEIKQQKGSLDLEDWLSLTSQTTLNVIASFQETVIDELLKRIKHSTAEYGVQQVIVTGGVAANQGLRKRSEQDLPGLEVLFPTPRLSTDNAAMIAAAAIPKYEHGSFSASNFSAYPNLTLT
jgi:N6-L-threonylcarbamoyladenine synthase